MALLSGLVRSDCMNSAGVLPGRSSQSGKYPAPGASRAGGAWGSSEATMFRAKDLTVVD
jgi:hypothetical protein